MVQSSIHRYLIKRICRFRLNNKLSTEFVKDNGFNPIWNEKVKNFSVELPDISFLRFAVYDKEAIGEQFSK